LFDDMDNRQMPEISHESVPWKRYASMVVAICLGLGFSLAVFFLVRWWEYKDIEASFRLAAEDRVSAVKGIFETEMAMLELVRSTFNGIGDVRRYEFQKLLAPFNSYSHSIFAVEWIPRVPDGRRQEYEAAAISDGIEGFQITELNEHGRLVRASKRSEYFPIYFIGPHPGDKTVFGFDIASEPVRLEDLRQARDSGKTVAGGRITFVQDDDKEKEYGFLINLPVYEKGKPAGNLEERRENFRGVVLGVFKPSDMIESALERLQPEGIDVCLYDASTASDVIPFHFHSSRMHKQSFHSGEQRPFDPQGMHRVARLDVAGDAWSIVCSPTPEFIAARRTWWPWGVMATGLGITSMLAAYLVLSLLRRAYIERLLVEKRRYARILEEKVREQTLDIRRAQEEVIHRLTSASQCRDEETGMHIRRTGLLSELLAKAAGWSAAEAEVIRLAAPMHDIGKIGIPDAILRKPGKLTAEEFEIMKTHTTIGADMLAGTNVPMLMMAREIAMNHHEKWDGEGYPAGRSMLDIPESARIVAIVDVFDALTHDRVYRPALPEEEVLKIMRQGAGTHFDSLLLAHFFSHLAEFFDISKTHEDELLEAEATGISCAPIQSASPPLNQPDLLAHTHLV
jgi:HD-GYP domain-containing protein (c-di-GMP phosphodiesterase class II)/CHASE1-domain containing sensor protein